MTDTIKEAVARYGESLPCPFCGATPKVMESYDQWSISCECGPIMWRAGEFSEVLAGWNRRDDIKSAVSAAYADAAAITDDIGIGWGLAMQSPAIVIRDAILDRAAAAAAIRALAPEETTP